MTAKWVQGTPPKYITARVATTNTSEVPRSGCRKTRPAGASPRPDNARCAAVGEPRLAPSMTKPARARISRSLPSSEGWKAEEGEFEGAPRAAGGEAEDEDERDRDAEEGVDPDPQLAEARVVDAGEHEHPDDAEQAVDRLPVDVVVGAAGDVVRGRLAESVKTLKATRPSGGERQRPVHVGEAEAFADRRRRIANGSGLRRVAAAARRTSSGLPPLAAPASGSACLAEIRFEDLQGRRRRGFGAEAAFLDGHDRDDARVRVRGQRPRTRTGRRGRVVRRCRSCRRPGSGSRRRRRRRCLPAPAPLRAGPPGSLAR